MRLIGKTRFDRVVESNFNQYAISTAGTRERDYPLKVDKVLRTRWFRQ